LMPVGGRRIGSAPAGCAAGCLAVQITQLTVIIVVDLAATFKIQGKIMVFMRSEGEAGANRVVTAFNRRCTTFADGAVVIETQIRGAAVIQTGTYGQPHHPLNHRATGIQTGLAGIAIITVFLEGMIQADRTSPLAGDLLGNDVDHTAHRIGAVESGHWATDHLDTLNG